jgi:hypothetical protein
MIEYNGEKFDTVVILARHLGQNYGAVKSRIKRGKNPDGSDSGKKGSQYSPYKEWNPHLFSNTPSKDQRLMMIKMAHEKMERDSLLKRTLDEMQMNDELTKPEDMSLYDLLNYVEEAAKHLGITDENLIADVHQELS